MDNQSYSNLIEAYLNNQLTETERLNFEHLCIQDPILNSELKLQQDIINAIQEYRKAELKQRLALIPTEGLISSYSFLKSTLVALGLSGILLTSGILAYQSYTSTSVLLDTTSKKLTKLLPEIPVNIEEEKETIILNKVENTHPIEEVIEVSTPIQSAVDYTSVTEKIEETFSNLNHHENLSKTSAILFDELTEEDSTLKSEENIYPPAQPDIQYQYYNDKLFLHNNISRGIIIPYENHNGITKYYLLYEGYYYEINNNQEEIATPRVVKDVNVILELKKLQELYGR